MNKVLILGCDGYIGEHLIEALAKEDFILFGYDLKGTKKNTKELLKKFYRGDIQNLECLESCILDSEPNIIIDLAANAEVHPNSDLDSYEMNFCTPDNILKILEKNNGLVIQRLIFTSSQYVIGPEHSGQNKMGYAPHTTYGVSKVLLEQRVLNLYENFLKQGSELFVIRPTNVWGGRHPKYSNMWENLLQKWLVMIPSKEVIKSYCHITTLCNLFENIIKIEDINVSKNNVIIYGTDIPITQREWVDLQVQGLRKNGISAGYFTVPLWSLYFLSCLIEAISRIFRFDNPLPWSRVDSMSYSYLVSLESPRGLSFNASYDELLPRVIDDVKRRKIG